MKDPTSALLLLANMAEISEFRDRHWKFTKQYILKYTTHPIATGGTPIVQWLPNQLDTVLKAMEAMAPTINKDKLSTENKNLFEAIAAKTQTERRVLKREVAEIQK